MRIFIRAARVISAACSGLAQISIFGIMILTVIDVILRHTVKTAIVGVTEYSQMLMAIILLATAYAGMSDNHIKVDILMNHMPEKVQKVTSCFTSLLAAVISGLIGSRAYVEALRAFEDHQTYLTLGLVKWPFYLLYALAFTALFITAIALIFQTIMNLRGTEKGGSDQ